MRYATKNMGREWRLAWEREAVGGGGREEEEEEGERENGKSRDDW